MNRVDTPEPAARRAITLRDVLVVIGIVMLLFGLLIIVMPPVVSVSRHPHRLDCANNIRQILLAMHEYESSHGHLPSAFTTDRASGRPLHSWRVLILPFLEEQDRYNDIRLLEPWDSTHNHERGASIPSVYRCPAHYSVQSDCTSYVVICGPETAFDGKPRSFEDFSDGTSQTIILIEHPKPDIHWMSPEDLERTAAVNYWSDLHADHNSTERDPWSYRMHASGVNVGFADGAVQNVHMNFPPDFFAELTTIAGGEGRSLASLEKEAFGER